MAKQCRVYTVKFTLSMQDPDMPSPRYHTTIFVETEANGNGYVHHVTGDITSIGGMYYEKKYRERPELSRTFYSRDLLGVTDASAYQNSWENVLRQVPPPPRQKSFNPKTMRTEPFKTENPLTFYEYGEVRQPLVKCTEWTLERAIPALRSAGLLH
ncbi:hypothetical protein EMCG_03263 [[Emmonsia] crescens]|uniref:Uncharacterized protein n=1 Tax=[Emmonsia] crescens TaxID=73230 RepID=A0A0G2HX38_9EURO|nr:hypothetical protein EMCG_03263 [Emmonsia crescens UAMH 3008]